MNIPLTTAIPFPMPPGQKELPDKEDEASLNMQLRAAFPYPTPPGHKELPYKDGSTVVNFSERPQMALLTDPLIPVLRQIHPDGHYVIGTDNAIYWRLTEPRLQGFKAPDRFYVPNRPQLLDGEIRRSYVMWMEGIPPLVIVEQVSGDGSEEHDRTAETGKMWVYEQVLRVPFYAIFDGFRETLEVHHLMDGRYQRMTPNEQGRYPIPPLRVELGLWTGAYYFDEELVWARWWDQSGKLLPTPEEQNALRTDEMAEVARQAEEAREQAKRLADKLRSLGINPDEV